MRRITAAIGVAAVVLMATGLAAQATSFAGKWILDPASAPAAPAAPAGGGGGGRGGGRGGGLGAEMTITQDASNLTIAYMGGGQNPAPVTLTYKLDGTESKNTVAGRGGQMEQVSKATLAGGVITIVTTTAAGEQKRTLTLEGGNLVVDTTNPGRDGGPAMSAKVTYKKAM